MLKKFNDCGIRAIFAGHYHRNGGGKFENLEMIVTSALGAQLQISDDKQSNKSGYRIVEINENSIQHHYVDIE